LAPPVIAIALDVAAAGGALSGGESFACGVMLTRVSPIFRGKTARARG
jgi:hypothetical protein